MESELEIYRRLISAQPACEDSWFTDALAKYRAGDEAAGRTISGSCLRLAMQIAEARAAEFGTLSVLDVVQEANVGLMDALKSFTGSCSAEFLTHATQVIHQRLQSLPVAI
jgi:DNA-directed RNA polymerase sigma subunit (sigma70/sigma32)